MRSPAAVLRSAASALLRAAPILALPALAYGAGGFDGAGNFFDALSSTITDNDREVIMLAAAIGAVIGLLVQSWKPFIVALVGGAILASLDSIVDWIMGLMG